MFIIQYQYGNICLTTFMLAFRSLKQALALRKRLLNDSPSEVFLLVTVLRLRLAPRCPGGAEPERGPWQGADPAEEGARCFAIAGQSRASFPPSQQPPRTAPRFCPTEHLPPANQPALPSGARRDG